MMSVIGKGDEEGLRHVEKDVLIPKKMKAKAMKLCHDTVKEFEDCVRGRTVSAAWHCQKESKKMQECFAKHFEDRAFYEESKQEYLQERDKFRTSGEPVQNPKRTS